MTKNQLKVKRALKKTGFSQSVLAEHIASSQYNVSRYSSGKREPPKSVIMLLDQLMEKYK